MIRRTGMTLVGDNFVSLGIPEEGDPLGFADRTETFFYKDISHIEALDSAATKS